MDKRLEVVGKNLPRLGAYEKATGRAKYTDDLHPNGTLCCKLLRSPFAHARIVSVDVRRAERVKGVKAVLTHQDIPQILIGEAGPQDTYLLTDKARYLGDEIAAVAAETEAMAEKALELIKVEYEELPILLNAEDALKPEAPLIPPSQVSDSNLLLGMARTTSQDWGSVENGFREADDIIEDVLSISGIQHMALETRSFIASWDENGLTLWAPTQHLFDVRSGIAQFLNIPETQVRVISQYVGGGFGGKGDQVRHALIAALLAKKALRPVKLTLTREEDMLACSRPKVQVRVKFGLKKEGAFTAIEGNLVSLGGGYNGAITAGCATTSLRALYRCSNCRFDVRSVYTNHSPTGQLRGILNTVMATGVLQLADQAAEKLDFPTPMDFIRKTHVREGEPCDTIFDRPGCTLSSCGLDECLELGAEAIKWAQIWKGWGTPAAIRGSKRVGLGMSAFAHDSAIGNMSSSAILKVNLDGTADFLIAVGEIGNGVVTTQTQVVSEASGIPFDNIRVINADTMYVPVDPTGIVCSSSAHIRALAAESAGKNVKKQLVEMAARYLEVQPEVLEIKNGNIFLPGNPSKSMTIKQLMQQIHSGKALPVSGVGIGVCPRFPQKAYNFGAHFAMVEVDTETGQIRVLDYVAAHDVGKAINPAVCEAQIQGGVVMGISSTLTEELVFDEKGRILNLGMTDYKIYTSADSPIIRPLIIESGDPLGAYGAKGFAESPMVGTPGCLANAIYNAIGIRFKEFPITPERVLAALKTRLS